MNKSYSAYVGMFVIICAILIGLYYRNNKNSIVDVPTFTVGMMSGWAPFMSINAQGEYEGFDVDVAQEIAQRLKKELTIYDLGSLSSCFVALEQERVDAVLSGLDITQKRRDIMNMIRYTGDDTKTFSLIFWETIPCTIKTIEDICQFPDAIVSVESGSAQEKFLDTYECIIQKRMNSIIDIILDLRFGKCFAAVVEPRVARRLARQNPELKIVPIVLPDNFKVFGCGIALKKENTYLTNEIAKIITDMYNDGTLQKLESKWQLEE